MIQLSVTETPYLQFLNSFLIHWIIIIDTINV